MGASMSAPTPISQQPADIAYEFLGFSPAAIGPVNRKAAPASHAHPLGKTSSRAVGFGLMQTLSASYNAPVCLLTPLNALPALSVYTMEAFISSFSGLYNCGWGAYRVQTGLTFPFPASATGALPALGLRTQSGGPSWILPDGTSIATNNWTGMGHIAVSCDGTTLRFFVDGVLQYSTAAVAIPEGCSFGPCCGYGQFAAASSDSFNIDEMRVSTVARYTADFVSPSEPFSPDPYTWGLWHLDDTPVGTWFGAYQSQSPGSNPYPLALPQSNSSPYGYSGASIDSSGNGNDLWVSDQLLGGIIGGSPPICDIEAQPSSISATSGVADFSGGVIALNGQSGGLWITNPAGVPFPVVPVSGQPSQIQISGGGGPGDPWSWLVSPVT